MSGDTLVWFLAGIGVGLAVAMLAFLILSIADRRSLSRQRRQRDARAEDLPAAPSATQAIRRATLPVPQPNRIAEPTVRNTPRQQVRSGGDGAGLRHDHEPDFGFFQPSAASTSADRREPDLVFDLTDLPEVATPAPVDAYVPSFDAPVQRPIPVPAQLDEPADAYAETPAHPPEPVEASDAADDAPETLAPPPAASPVPEAPQKPEIRRPAPPPKPLPAAAGRHKAQTPPAASPVPPKGPAPVSIAPLRSAAARVSGDGSKAPANFRPLLPKADGASRQPRQIQRRPFTEITIPFEGPATLVPAADETPPPPPAALANPAGNTAATAPTAAAAAIAEPQSEPVAVEMVTAPEAPKAPPAADAAIDEAALDSAAAQSIEQGSGKSATNRAAAQRVEKALPKMPPPRLTPDTVEAIFAEAFARGSAEPPDRKS